MYISVFTNRLCTFAAIIGSTHFFSMSTDKKKGYVHIKCNSVVKKFTMERVRQLGIDVGLAQLYVNLSKDGSTSCKRDANVVKLAEKLNKIIPSIRPRILLTTADVNELTQFITKWKARVSELIVERQYTPIYYEDVVNSLLLGKSDIKCSRVHLEWCLSILGPKNMKPGKIVDVILKHDSKEWDELLPLANDAYYSVRLEENSEEIQADFRKKIEFIYRLSNPALTDSIIDELQNDVNIVNGIKQLREEATTNYRDMIKKYLEFISRLQTVTSYILPKKLIKKMEGIVNQEKKDMETAEVEVKPRAKAVSVKSDGIMSEKSKTPTEGEKTSVAQDSPRKDDNDNTAVSIMPNNNDSKPAIDDIPFEEDISDYPDGEPGNDQFNYEELMDYLNEKLINDSSGREKIKNAMDVVYAFCKLEDFSKRFAQLRAMIDSGTVKWPGGFAVGEMRKMLNPEYVPNIR